MKHYLWKQNKALFVVTTLLVLAVSGILLYMPKVLGDIVDTLTSGETVNISAVVLRLFWVICAGIVILTARSIANEHYKARRKINMERDLAAKLTSKLRDQSDVVNIYNQEIEVVNTQYLNVFFQLLQSFFSFGLALALGLSISWEIILWILAFTVVMLLINQFFAKRLAALAKAVQDSSVAMNRTVVGIFSAIRTINIFFAKTAALTRLDRVFEERRRITVRKVVFDSYVTQLNNFLGWVVQYGLIVGAYILVYLGKINIGQTTTLLLLMQYLSDPMFTAMQYKNTMASTKDIRKRLEAILNEPDEIVTRPLPPAGIVLRDVSFRYKEDEAFLSVVNLEFEHGKRYLIVGQSGSGKSTLLKLILKEFTPQSGIISYGGLDLAGVNAPTWFQNIAYTSQKVEILPGTLRENIVLDAPYDEKRFSAIIRLLNLGYLSGKMDDPLNEDWSNFSGGELQRVAIARMLYDDSPIFIFDEFSSALDNINARQIESELLKIDGKLLISVTHRIQSDLLGSYEKVVIMENGSVKHVGRPADLAEELRPFLSGDEVSAGSALAAASSC